MITIVKALLAMIRSLFKSRSALHVEILVLRHQLNVLGRGSCHRIIRADACNPALARNVRRRLVQAAMSA